MTSLIKKIFKSNLAINLRNLFNFFPVKINTNHLEKNFSISDSFPWRTDSNYKTIFRFNDLLNFFYEDRNKSVDLKFFTKDGILLKSIESLKINLLNSLIIDKKFMSGIEDYGTFSIFHKTLNNQFSIRNSCYTGFSYEQRSYSHVHGNIPTTAKPFNDQKKIYIKNIIGKSLLINQIYKIQNRFDDSDFIELFIHNPCDAKIKFIVEEKKFSLKSNSSLIIKLKKKEITIRSNCYLLRPIIFNYKNNMVDVFHG